MLKLKAIKKEIFSRPIPYLLLSVILIIGFILRVYRVDDILGFHFDQGRDALVIWDLIHDGKIFLIGPTTGIAGIFRGPFYYYLIAPFYLIGGGNPVWPAVFLAFTTVIASLMAYYLGKKIHSSLAGLIAAFISAFSYNLVFAGRWLSNPTPMLLLSLIMVLLMLLITQGKRWAWPLLAFVAGLSLFHFGSSGEFFYFPAIAVFSFWQRKNLPSRAYFMWSIIAFGITFLPLFIFDIRHEGILRNNIGKFLFGEDTFSGGILNVFMQRIRFYYDVFTSKIFLSRQTKEIGIFLVVAFAFLIFVPRFLKNKGITILILLLAAPICGLFFFQGNQGNIYDYYMTGYYLIFVLLFSITLAELSKYLPGKIFVVWFLWLFLNSNWDVLRYRLTLDNSGPQTIAFENQKQAIDWVFLDADTSSFNVDIYVPPVIPYAYDYLFKWYPTTPRLRNASAKLVQEQVPLLYTISEVDPPHPDRIGEWFKRQDGIGRVEKETSFGGILVQRRTRI